MNIPKEPLVLKNVKILEETIKIYKKMEKVKVKLNGGMMPQKATKGSAAFDIYVPEDMEIGHGRQVVDMKFAIELPDSKAALIKPRSGCTLRGIQVLNTVTGKTHCIDAEVKIGLVDSDYRKNVGTLLQVYDVPVLGERWIIQKGSRISQMRIVDVPEVELVEVSELSESEREGGFGSTGVL